jgi:hypothetical protein
MKTIENDGMMEVAKEMCHEHFKDGKRFTALLFDRRVIRCTLQEGVEAMLNRHHGARIEWLDNYTVAIIDSGEVVGVVWPQN